MNRVTCATLPRIGYILRLHHVNGPDSEEYAYWDLKDAQHHFELFDESDAELYSSIELLAYDYQNRVGRLLAIAYFIVEEDDETDDGEDEDFEEEEEDEADNCIVPPNCPFCSEKLLSILKKDG